MKLNIRLANGTEQLVHVDAKGLKLLAQPGTTYKVVDGKTGKTAKTASAKRVDDDLVIDGGSDDPGQVRIERFFNECTPDNRCWAMLDTPADAGASASSGAAGGLAGSGSGGEIVITQDSHLFGTALVAGETGSLVNGQVLSLMAASSQGGAAAAAAGGFSLGDLGWPAVAFGAIAATTAGGAASDSGHGSSGGSSGSGGNGGGENLESQPPVSPSQAGGEPVQPALPPGSPVAEPGQPTQPVVEPVPPVVPPGQPVPPAQPGGQPVLPLTIEGSVAAGLMREGTVDVAVYDKDGNLLGHSLVDTNGRYQVNLDGMRGYAGGLLVVARDVTPGVVDNYIDEASDALTNLVMHLSAVGSAPGGTPVVTINITPITEFAVQLMGMNVNAPGAQMKPPADLDMAARVNQAVGVFFGVPDILGEVVTVNSAGFRGASAQATNYGLALARLSERDGVHGSIAATLQHLMGEVWMDAGVLYTSHDDELTLGTSRTVSTLADGIAAAREAVAVYQPTITQANAASLQVVVALPANATVGDLVHLKLTGTAGTVDVTPQVVTADDVARGFVRVAVAPAELLQAGTGNVTPSTVFTDAAGHNASMPHNGRAFFADVDAPAPVLSLDSSHNGQLGAADSAVGVNVAYAGMAAGDVIQLKLDGSNALGTHVVTAAEAARGVVVLTVPAAVLGADGVKQVSAVVTDNVGNVGTSAANAPLAITVDTTAPAPTVTLAPGQLVTVTGQDPAVELVVSYPGLVVGDVVQVQVGGRDVGAPHTVTAADVAAGHVSVAVDTNELGADGTKQVAVVVTDPAGNAGTSPDLPLLLATGRPSLTVGAGHDADLRAGETMLPVHVTRVGLLVGDSLQLKLAGNAFGAPYTVTAADVAAGGVTLNVTVADLGADGTKVLSADVDNQASAPLLLTLDTDVPAPSLSLAFGEDAYLNAGEPGVQLDVAYAGLRAGDTVQLKLAGVAFGAPHTVTALEAAAGHIQLSVLKAGLGADGVKSLSADVTDGVGNVGSSAPLALTLDTSAPTPTLAFSNGHGAFLNAGEASLALTLSWPGLQAGETVQLQLGNGLLGTPYTVTAADVVAGFVTLPVQRADLGADGVKALGATVTDLAGNTGHAAALSLSLDTGAPAPTLALAAGQDGLISAVENGVTLVLGLAGAQPGDVVQLRVGGVAIGAPYTVTAADITAGSLSLPVAKADLGADGAKSLTATVTDAAGNVGSSAPLGLTLDTGVPSPTLSLDAGQDAFVNAAESGVTLVLGLAGAQAGDVVQLHVGGVALGAPYTVNAADVAAGSVSLPVAKADLGADGAKSVTATVTDAAGNVGTTASALGLIVDTVLPVPTVALAPGESATVNVADTAVEVDVTHVGLEAGDVIQLSRDGQAIGSPYTVTAADVSAGHASLWIQRVDLGADGTRHVTAAVTDVAGNVGHSAPLPLHLDTHPPMLAFSTGLPGLTIGVSSLHLGSLGAGVQLVDAGSQVDDGTQLVGVTQLSVDLSGFHNGADEVIRFGGVALTADGSGAPGTLTVAGQTWNLQHTPTGYVFTAVNGAASANAVAALMQTHYNNLAAGVIDGQRVLSFVATDVAGNASDAVTARVMLATVPPAIAPAITTLSDDTGVAGDFRTTVASQTVSGTYVGLVNPGDRIQLSLDGNTWVDATIVDGQTWSVVGITLNPGANPLYVRAIDLAGNATVATSHPYVLDSANIATHAAITGAVDDVTTHGSTAGALASGTSTDDDQPTLGGTVDAPLTSDQVVAVYDTVGGVVTRLGTATVVGGAWTFTSPSLAVGSHDLHVVVESPNSGATGTPSAAFNVNVQSISLQVTDRVGQWQGAVADQGSTDDAQPLLEGTLGTATLGAGEVVGVYDNGSRIGTATLSGNAWSFTPAARLPDGAHAFVAVIEPSGNTALAHGRVVTAALHVDVDTSNVAPTQTVTITSVTDDDATRASTTGTVSSGDSTDDRTPTLAGSLSAGLGTHDVVAVYDTVGGVVTRLGTATVTGTSWSFTSPALGLGAHTFTAVVERAGTGLQGTPSAAFTLVEQSIDLTAVLDDQLIHVSLNDNALTDDNTPTLNGTLGAALGSGEVVAIYGTHNGVTTKLGVATVTGTDWTFTSGTLPDGLHMLRAMVQDGATGTATSGRVVSSDFTMTVLTVLNAPTTQASVTGAIDDVGTHGSFTGTLASGRSTDDRTPTLTGTLTAPLGIEEVLAVYDGGTRVGYASVSGTGWSFTTPSLAGGSHSFTTAVVNVLTGVQGAASAPFVVIEQSIAATGLLDDVGASQGQIAPNGVTDDARPTFSGTLGVAALGAGEVVAIYDGNTKIGEATVTGTAWSFTPSSDLSDGTHELRAIVQDGPTGTAGNGGVVSATSTFTVNTSGLAPTQTVLITGAVDDDASNGSRTGAFASGTSTDDRTPTIDGTISTALVAGQAVVVYDGATRLGLATVNGTSWTFTTPQLAVGSHALTAVVENQGSGLQGTPSAAWQVVEQSLGMDDFAGLTGAVNVNVGNLLGLYLGPQQTLTGTLGSATLGTNEVVALYDGGARIGTATVNGTGWSYTPSGTFGNGFHQITAVIQDAGATTLSSARVATGSQSFNIDLSVSLPLAVTTILAVNDDLSTNGSVVGAITGVTDDNTPTVTGLVASLLVGPQVVAVYDGATRLGNATVNGLAWSFTTPALALGTHTLTARVENPVANTTGTVSLGAMLTVQSISAPSVYDDFGTRTGTVANNGVTDDRTPTISGTLGTADFALLDAVAIYDTVNGVTVKLGLASVSGTSWSFTPLLPLADGNHTFTAVVQDALSLVPSGTVISSPVSVTIDRSVPTQTVAITSVVDGTSSGNSKSGVIATLGSLDDTQPLVNGTLSASLSGSQVVVVYDTTGGMKTRLGEATLSSGNALAWSFEPGTPLAAGTHVLTAVVENVASGTPGVESLGYTLVERPVTLHVMDNAGALQGDVLQFAAPTTNDTSLLLTGSIGTPLGLVGGLLEQVRVYDNGTYLGNATVNGTDYSFNLNSASLGTHNLSVRVTDILGGYQVAAGGSFTVASSDVPATTADVSYGSTSVTKLSLDGKNSLLDLTAVSGAAQPQLDVVRLGGSNNTVKLAVADVLQGSIGVFDGSTGWSGINGAGKHQVLVDGSSGTVAVADSSSWTAIGSAAHAGNSYVVYENTAHTAQLLIDSHLSRTGVM